MDLGHARRWSVYAFLKQRLFFNFPYPLESVGEIPSVQGDPNAPIVIDSRT